ncbi:uncharacterized protein LOC131237034 [Magnolia sinica]|uniref:uncharacterized protein LOC131237034 n=1 Tax=Magnolia sinica TaxID=86752 RepID=UPI002659626E|nr:uncharacterized protein LOC131237034 [Magnolia sinica]XP_058090633.1 uncharacterized protein LOC131237034 [Magnolia sinica]XP_058090634.1 uncharacterized protein LOC131237034 [Magnolia sinica]
MQMVQQMIDAKVNEYGLSNNGTGLPTCDKPQPVLAKKTALRDLQNETRNIIARPSGNSSLPKEKVTFTNATKVCGSKRSTPDPPLSPACNQPSCNNGPNGHLVYVRRRTESEPGSTNTCNAENAESPQPIKSSNGKQELHGPQNRREEPKVACFPAFAPMPATSLATFSSGGPSVPNSTGKLRNGLAVSEPNYNTIATGTPYLVSPLSQRTGNRHWEERFSRLQTFLKTCDQSSQEEYVKQLRSLSAIDRSRHAVELEKRAILLSLEEGKEIQRVKALNVLGKSSPKNYGSATAQSHFLQSLSNK